MQYCNALIRETKFIFTNTRSILIPVSYWILVLFCWWSNELKIRYIFSVLAETGVTKLLYSRNIRNSSSYLIRHLICLSPILLIIRIRKYYKNQGMKEYWEWFQYEINLGVRFESCNQKSLFNEWLNIIIIKNKIYQNYEKFEKFLWNIWWKYKKFLLHQVCYMSHLAIENISRFLFFMRIYYFWKFCYWNTEIDVHLNNE